MYKTCRKECQGNCRKSTQKSCTKNFQWICRRHYREKQKKKNAEGTPKGITGAPLTNELPEESIQNFLKELLGTSGGIRWGTTFFYKLTEKKLLKVLETHEYIPGGIAGEIRKSFSRVIPHRLSKEILDEFLEEFSQIFEKIPKNFVCMNF